MPITNKDTKVITGEVRFSYAHVFQPQAIEEGSEPKYSISLLIPKKDKETIKRINTAIDAAIEAGKSKLEKNGKINKNALKLPLRDGDVEREDDPTYAGCYFINATSKQRPGVVDKDRQEIIDTEEFYSGCYGRASINFYAFAVSGNKGIAAGLNNVQKLKDGDYLGGRSSADDDFAEDDDDLLG